MTFAELLVRPPLPRPPFTEQETEARARRLYEFVWQQSESGFFKIAA